MLLTVRTAAALTLPAGKQDAIFFDNDVPGFGLRLRASGARNWVYQYRIGSQQRRINLGNAKSVPLAIARENAGKIEAKVRLGEDPAQQREIAKRDAESTFVALVAQYIDARESKWRPRTAYQTKLYLLNDAKALHRLPITAVTQRDIAVLLTHIAATSGSVSANRVRSTLSAFLSWVIREGHQLPAGNVAALTNKREERPRERVLTDNELRLIWSACDGEGDYGAIIRLLMLTGQRASEIGGLRWSEITENQISLPPARTKNGRQHSIPLSDPARGILGSIANEGGVHVFGRDDTGWQNWGRAKVRFDTKLTLAEPWTPHDLRRTAATGMAELGVQPHIIEAVLNHVSGHKGGVAGIYNRATYDKEKREALNLWGQHVTALVRGADHGRARKRLAFRGNACPRRTGYRRGPAGHLHDIAESVGAREADPAEVLAHALLNGVYKMDERKRVTHYYLSRDTEPTEKEGRMAVAELLSRLGPLGSPEPPSWLLKALAITFAPEIALDPKPYARTVEFKQVSTSRSRPLIDWFIAALVHRRRREGKTREDAIGEVAEVYGYKDAETVRKIYDREKGNLKRDKIIDNTASDS